jgi:hypothetical protein
MLASLHFVTGALQTVAEHDHSLAIASFQASLAAVTFQTNDVLTVSARGYLGRMYAVAGDGAASVDMVRHAVLLARGTGSRVSLAAALDYGGQALITLGHDLAGVTFIVAATAGNVASRPMGGLELQRRNDALATARERLGEEDYQRAVAIGESLSAEAALATAIDALDRIDAPIIAP